MKFFVLICLWGLVIADNKDIAQHTNHFGIDVHQQLAKAGGNLVFSPFSLASALALLLEGAGESSQTEKEIKQVLHYDNLSHKEIDAFYENAMKEMKPSDDLELTVANSVWIKQGFTVKPDFTKHLKDIYLATQDEFTPDDAGLLKINAWANKSTKGKIAKILDQAPTDIMMALMNAIYFKAKWVNQFVTKDTNEMDFKETADGSPKKVKMMHQTESFGYTNDQDLKAEILSMYYKGQAARCMVFLPHNDSSLEQLEAKLTHAAFKVNLNAQTTKVHVHLPKFKLASNLESLANTLKELKMTSAFTKSADFSGITDPTSLMVDKVIQKAIIEVNEEGTEAAAVTAVIMKMSASLNPPPIPVFLADRPFLYAVQHVKTETVLFMGRYVKVEP